MYVFCIFIKNLSMYLFVFLGIWNDFIHFLERNMVSCSWKKQFGIECVGCGMQRSLILILKGEFINAYKMYPPIYTIIIMVVFLLAHLKFKFKNGHNVVLSLFILNLMLILANYFIKIN